MENSRRLKIAVVGFGNILMGDEGIGVHVVKELQNPSTVYRLPSTVELIDGGTSALDVILSLKDIEKLVVIDAVKNGGIPGEIYKFHNFTPDFHRGQNSEMQKTSLHDLNLVDALKIAEKLGAVPKEIVLIGVEPKEIEPKMELSEEIRNKIPEIIKTVLCEVKQ
ncbi:MAG: HyaD/HybD family hydrogenase maturation endopeptidase [Elusimicrobiota bacterium]|nr:HyaD/HybD family hydrogenase maturation endopeptidase [Elusimicrobiota bacterium]